MFTAFGGVAEFGVPGQLYFTYSWIHPTRQHVCDEPFQFPLIRVGVSEKVRIPGRQQHAIAAHHCGTGGTTLA